MKQNVTEGQVFMEFMNHGCLHMCLDNQQPSLPRILHQSETASEARSEATSVQLW